ncbi:MAG: hypothetical protein NTV88_00375 [Candidatus Micrarchaeota archaeon]|nr:hypothetical protein [Candidatus Micrarchaeota archaeon]
MKTVLLLALVFFAGVFFAADANATANFADAGAVSAAAPVPVPKWAAGCNFGIERKISSSKWITTVTSTISNNGGAACSMKNLIFEDYLSSEFGKPWEISYSPQIIRIQNRSVRFLFAAFAPGEKKTLVYGVPFYVSDLHIGKFTQGLLYPVKDENESVRQAFAPSVRTVAGSDSSYDATVTITAVGVFIILSSGIGVIYYFERKKKEKTDSENGKKEN